MNLSDRVGRWWDWLSTELLSEGGGLGVCLDRTGLTLAHLQKTFSGVLLKNFAHLPGDLEKPADFGPALKEAVSAWGLAGAPVSLAVSRGLGFVRQAALPLAAGDNLAQVVAYEIDRFLPLPAEGLYFDFQRFQESGGEIHLTLFALPREPVAEYLEILSQAGLRPASVELASTAAANAFAALGGKLPASWMLVHLEEDGFEISQIAGHAILSARQVRAARAQDLLPLLLDAIGSLRAGEPSPEAVLLYGPKGTGRQRAALSQRLDLPLVTSEMVALDGLPPEAPAQAALLAVGAALRSVGRASFKINLLPAAERAQATLGGFTLGKFLLAAFLGLLSLFIVSVVIHKRVELYQLNRQLAQLSTQVRQVEAQLEESRALAKHLQSFRRLEQSPDKLLILQRLTQLVPEHTWLFHLRISQQTLEISGISKSAADLIPILEKSGWLTKTEFVSPIVTDANKLENFKIKAEIKGLEPAA